MHSPLVGQGYFLVSACRLYMAGLGATRGLVALLALCNCRLKSVELEEQSAKATGFVYRDLGGFALAEFIEYPSQPRANHDVLCCVLLIPSFPSLVTFPFSPAFIF